MEEDSGWLSEDTLYNIFNDRTLMEMIPDEETLIETEDLETIGLDPSWIPDEGTERSANR